MKSRTLIILAFLVMGVAVNLSAQTDKQKQDEITKQRLNEGLARGNNNRMLAQSVDLQVQDSKYNHQEKEILAKLNTDAIPQDFPVYKSEFKQEEYTALMNKWYSANPTLLKKETTK